MSALYAIAMGALALAVPLAWLAPARCEGAVGVLLLGGRLRAARDRRHRRRGRAQ